MYFDNLLNGETITGVNHFENVNKYLDLHDANCEDCAQGSANLDVNRKVSKRSGRCD